MSNKSEEFITWLYRAIIGTLITATLAVVTINYNQFQDMRTAVDQQKIINQGVDFRLSQLEKK